MPFNSQLSDDNITRLGSQGTDKVLSEVKKEFADSTKLLQDWKSRVVKYYELYALVQRKKHYEGLANLFIPEILRAVETITAKIYQMVFAQPDWFQYTGRDNNGDEGSALAMNQLVLYQTEENNFKACAMDAIRQMVIAGLVVRKAGWDYEEVSRTKKAYSEEGPKEVEDVETVKDTWVMLPVDLLSFHISDVNIPYYDVQKARWIGEETLVRKEWVDERCRRGWFSKLMKGAMSETPDAPSSQSFEFQKQKLLSSGFQDVNQKERIQIKERWGLCPAEWVLNPESMKSRGYEEGDQIESVIVVANDRSILKLEENPWWHKRKPYVACPYVPKEGELPGMGAAQIAESLQEEINDTRNQTMDNKTLILNNMWLKSRASGIKNEQLRMGSGRIIDTNDIAGLVPLRPPVVAGVGTNMESIAKNDLRESVGASSNLQGIAQAGVGTATESTIINRESMSRILMTAQLFGELILKPILLMAEFLNYQFYDHTKVIRIVGPVGVKFEKMPPEKIAGGKKDVSIKVALDGAENPAVLRQQFMNFATLLFGMAPEQVQYHYKTLDRAFGMFFSGHKLSELYENMVPEASDLLSPEEERDVVIAEQQVLAKRGQNHEAHIEYLEKEFSEMQWGLNPKQFDLFKSLIMSHYQLLQVQLMEQQEQFMAQQQMMAQQPQKSGNINKGSTKNTTPHNQTAAPSTESLRKGIGQ